MRKNVNKPVTVKIYITGIKQYTIFNSLKHFFLHLTLGGRGRSQKTKGNCSVFEKHHMFLVSVQI